MIVVDPPPPVEAAGSSLLFSRDFYELAKQHLNTNGIVQMWFPGDADVLTTQAVLRSFNESFPYIRCFPSVEGWGLHLLGSMQPIPRLTAKQLVAGMPVAAQNDLLEWTQPKDAVAYISQVIDHEYSITGALNPDPGVEVTDDQPYNEYFLLRWLKNKPATP